MVCFFVSKSLGADDYPIEWKIQTDSLGKFKGVRASAYGRSSWKLAVGRFLRILKWRTMENP